MSEELGLVSQFLCQALMTPQENGPDLGGSDGYTTQVANILNEKNHPLPFLDVIASARLQGSSFSSSKIIPGTFVPFSPSPILPIVELIRMRQIRHLQEKKLQHFEAKPEFGR